MWPQRPALPPAATSWPMPDMPANQWASYYQSVPSTQVDWAALAQQWIKMKEDTDLVHPSTAPLSSAAASAWPATASASLPAPVPHHEEGGGEANMDLDDEDGSGQEEEPSQASFHRPSFPDVYHSRSIPQTNSHRSQRKTSSSGASQAESAPQAHHSAAPPAIHSSGTAPTNSHSRRHPPKPLMSTIDNVKGQDDLKTYHAQMQLSSGLDAAARKKLPAWIREGLEKMEKEKQKKEYEEMRQRLREEKLQKRRQEEILGLQSNVDLSRSKFDQMNSDDDSDSEVESEVRRRSIAVTSPLQPAPPTHSQSSTVARKSRFEPHSGGKEEASPESRPAKDVTSVFLRQLSKEQLMDQLSVVMKRILTEVLLEVTSEEIQASCQEALLVEKGTVTAAAPSKARPVLGSISGYGSDQSTEEDDQTQHANNQSDGHNDDDSESDMEVRIAERLKHFEQIKGDGGGASVEQPEPNERRPPNKDLQHDEMLKDGGKKAKAKKRSRSKSAEDDQWAKQRSTKPGHSRRRSRSHDRGSTSRSRPSRSRNHQSRSKERSSRRRHRSRSRPRQGKKSHRRHSSSESRSSSSESSRSRSSRRRRRRRSRS